MSVSLREAKPLCTADEFELVQASFSDASRELKPAKLKQNIARARKLRNKYRDLAERQHREAVGKQEPRGARPSRSNDRTVMKQQLFQETMDRFEAHRGGDEAGGAASGETAAEHEHSEGPPTSAARAGNGGGGPVHRIIGERRRVSAMAGRRGKRTANPGEAVLNDTEGPRNIRLRTGAFVSRLPRKRSHFAESARQHIVGHVATQTRQNQARRDARN